MGWHGVCPLPGEQAQKGYSLAAKVSTYFDADDNKAAAARTCQLRVRVASFAPRGVVRGPSRLCVSPGLRLSRPRRRRDYGGIKGAL